MMRPHSSHSRRGSSRSEREKSAARVPNTGSTAPTRNQRKNELPLIFPIAPAERPKKNAMTRYCGTYSRRFSAHRIATTAAIATTVQKTADTMPIATLISTHAAISSTPTARAFPPRFESAEPPRVSMFSLMTPFWQRVSPAAGFSEQMRRAGRHVPVEPPQRHRAEHPARPVDREAERPQAPQQPPRERAREDAEHVRLLGHRDTVERRK